MVPFIFALVGILVLAGISLVACRIRKERRIDELWKGLRLEGNDRRFQAGMTDDLPEPARRYLEHALAPGTPLASHVELTIGGEILLSREGDPLPMESEELLTPPQGYIWKGRVRMGPVTIRGFDAYADGEAEMRWWLGGLVPVVRASGEALTRSAVGRLLGETVLLLPSFLLTAPEVEWEPVDRDTARVTLRAGAEVVTVTLEVGPEGTLRRLSFPRWNDDPKNGPVGYLTFVCDELGDERMFQGYRIPTRFRAGWRLGHPDASPFFHANVEEAEYG